MKEMNIQDILINEYLKKIFASNNYQMVYYKIANDLFDEYGNDLEFFRKIRDELYIEYLKELSKRSKSEHFYEMILFDMMRHLSDGVLEFLLSCELDMDYQRCDMFGMPSNLAFKLAVNVKSPKGMQMVIEKLKPLNRMYFGNDEYEIYTDLCTMNVIAGNLDEALKLFNSDNFSVFQTDMDVALIKEKLACDLSVYIDGFRFEYNDKLYQVLSALRDSRIPNEKKKEFLKKLLISSKINFFNIDGLLIIKEIFNDKEYQEFIKYLNRKVESKKISLFKSDDCNHLMTYASIENENAKVLRLRNRKIYD